MVYIVNHEYHSASEIVEMSQHDIGVHWQGKLQHCQVMMSLVPQWTLEMQRNLDGW